jgi:murein L,D-transpeptidase YafK
MAMTANPERGSHLLAALLVASFLLPTAGAAQVLAGRVPLGEPLPGDPSRVDEAAVSELSFRDRQMRFPRVRSAYDTRSAEVRRLLRAQDIAEPAELFFRVFKRERLLEVWARRADAQALVLVNTYAVCGTSGELGPKRTRGDEQIPEGFYSINVFNPISQFHLSLGVDYPNPVDRARTRALHPGGDIFIHGGCATVGCVPITDAGIEEVYVLALLARDAGQSAIPVHIFPTRLDDEGMAWLRERFGPDHPDLPFWENLRAGYAAFERTRTVPQIDHYRGRYSLPRGNPAGE